MLIMNTENLQTLIDSLKEKGIIDTEKISDGYHTFEDLYEQRVYLFAALCNTYPTLSWKSKKHHDGKIPFGDPNWFIVGIDTPEGQYTYHYEMKYWYMFRIPAIPKGKKWDGHTSKDVMRVLSLSTHFVF